MGDIALNDDAGAAGVKDKNAAYREHSERWRKLLEADPRPLRSNAPSDEEYERRLTNWYGYQLNTIDVLQQHVLEEYRCRSDWFYAFLFGRSRERIAYSNGLVEQMCTQLLAWLRTTFAEAKTSDADQTVLLELLEQTMCREVVAEMRNGDDDSPQLYKHFFVFVSLAFFPGVLDWMCYGDAAKGVAPPGVLDVHRLRAYVQHYVKPHVLRMLEGSDDVVLTRFVYDCRAEYPKRVGLARGPDEQTQTDFELVLARREDVRRFVDRLFDFERAGIEEERLFHEQRARLQEVVWSSRARSGGDDDAYGLTDEQGQPVQSEFERMCEELGGLQ